MILISVDFPAPFSPTSAWTSPRRREKSTRSSAVAPAKRLTIPSMRRMTSPSWAFRVSAICGAVIWRASVRVGHELRGVLAVEEAIRDELLGRDLLSPAELLDRVERDRTEARVAFHGRTELTALDG